MVNGSQQAAYDVRDVASAIIRLAIAEGDPLTNLQLQKILYLCQLAYVKAKARLLFPEQIVAWQYGPVVKASYDEYSYRGASSLRKAHMTKRDWLHDTAIPVAELDDDTMSVIRPVVRKWSRRSMWELINESHKEDGPWDVTYNPRGQSEGAGYGMPIDPWRYANAYDPETCTVMVDKIAIDASEGDIDESPVATEDGDRDVELTITIPTCFVGTLRKRAATKGKTERRYVEDLVRTLLERI